MSITSDHSGLFNDAVMLLPEDAFSGSSNLGTRLVDGSIVTAKEVQFCQKMMRMIDENKTLKQVLTRNNERLKKHFEDCGNWKKIYKKKESALKNELLAEKKNSKLLESKLSNYEALANTDFSFSGGSLIEELEEYSKMLHDLVSLPPREEEVDEEEYAVMQTIAQDTWEIVTAFTTSPNVNRNELQRFQSKLIDVESSCKNNPASIGQSLKATITAIQDTVQKHSIIQFVGGKQQVSWPQYLDLQSKFEITVQENRQYRLQLEEMTDNLSTSTHENEKLTNDLAEAKSKLSTLMKELAESNEKLKSMQSEIYCLKEAQSVEFVVENIKKAEPTGASTEALNKEIQNLKNEITRLQNDSNETMEVFDRVETQNSELLLGIQNLKSENAQIKNDYKETMERLGKAETQNSGLMEKIEELQASQKKEEKFEIITEVLQQSNSELDELKKDLQAKEDEVKRLESKVKTLTEENEKSQLNFEKERSALKSEKKECKKKVDQLRRRETKDSDKIDTLKKENKDMKNHIENLQKLINKKAEKDKEVTSLELQSMQFVNKSDADMSICESITISTDDPGTLECSTDDEFASLTHDDSVNTYTEVGVSDSSGEEIKELKQEIQELQNQLALKEKNMQQLLEENTEMDQRVKSMTERQENVGLVEEQLARYTELEEENNHFKIVIAKVEEDFNKFTIQKEEEMSHIISKVKLSKHELDTKTHEIEELEHNLEKSKRDYTCLWQNYEVKANQLSELEKSTPYLQQRVDKLTAETVGARDLIEEKQLEVKKLHAQLIEQDHAIRKMTNDLDALPALRIQVDVYRNDFNAEREAREKQQNELVQQRERVKELSIENHRMREQLQMFSTSQLSGMARRHGTQSQHFTPPKQPIYETVHNPGHYGVRSTGSVSHHPQDYHQHGRRPGSSGSQYGSNPSMYGRGGDNRGSNSSIESASADKSDDTEQRKCPKCDKLFPDLDTLQIHLMDCLDN